MEKATLSNTLSKFVEQVSACYNSQGRPLTVNDLRLGVRDARMSEISDWSNHDLDLIEVHASSFDAGEPLESVLDVSSTRAASVDAATVASICAPSPFAWT